MACPRDKPLCRISAVEAAIFEPEGEDPLLVPAKSGVISIQIGPTIPRDERVQPDCPDDAVHGLDTPTGVCIIYGFGGHRS